MSCMELMLCVSMANLYQTHALGLEARRVGLEGKSEAWGKANAPPYFTIQKPCFQYL